MMRSSGPTSLSQSDGGLLLVGSADTTPDTAPPGTVNEISVVRLDGAGEPDGTFGHAGTVNVPVTALTSSNGAPGRDAGMAVALQPDGRIVVAGGTLGVNPDFAIVRLLGDEQAPRHELHGQRRTEHRPVQVHRPRRERHGGRERGHRRQRARPAVRRRVWRRQADEPAELDTATGSPRCATLVPWAPVLVLFVLLAVRSSPVVAGRRRRRSGCCRTTSTRRWQSARTTSSSTAGPVAPPGRGRPSTRCSPRCARSAKTMLVQSGKPVGVFRTHEWAPRVLLANSNLVPDWATWDEFRRLEAAGLTMYGQMTAGSWIYIGTQGILQGTYECFAEIARRRFDGSLAGTITLTAGLGGMGGAQPLAITMNDGVALCIDVDPARVQRRIDTRYLDVVATDVDDAIGRSTRLETPAGRCPSG